MREPRHAGQITSLFLYVSEVSKSEVSRDVRETSLGKKEKLDILFLPFCLAFPFIDRRSRALSARRKVSLLIGFQRG